MPLPAPNPFSPAEELALFEAFATHGLSLPHLSEAINDPKLCTQDVLTWLAQPHTRNLIDQLRRAHILAASLRDARARFTAIQTLEHVCTTDPDPTNQRRAATAILHPRASRKPNRQGGLGPAAGPTDADTNPQQEPVEERPHSPSQRPQGRRGDEGAGGWVRATHPINEPAKQTNPINTAPAPSTTQAPHPPEITIPHGEPAPTRERPTHALLSAAGSTRAHPAHAPPPS